VNTIQSNDNTKGLSIVSKTIISSHEDLIRTALKYNVPCYVAAVQYGLSPTDYQTGIMGLTKEHQHIRKTLDSTDFQNYMLAIADPEAIGKVELFTPLFAFPESTRGEVRTLKVVFEEPLTNIKDNIPSFIEVNK
jgi:hypothetical protein